MINSCSNIDTFQRWVCSLATIGRRDWRMSSWRLLLLGPTTSLPWCVEHAQVLTFISFPFLLKFFMNRWECNEVDVHEVCWEDERRQSWFYSWRAGDCYDWLVSIMTIQKQNYHTFVGQMPGIPKMCVISFHGSFHGRGIILHFHLQPHNSHLNS